MCLLPEVEEFFIEQNGIFCIKKGKLHSLLPRTSDPAAGVEFHYHHPDYPFGCSFSGLVSDTQNRAWMDGVEVRILINKTRIQNKQPNILLFFLPSSVCSTLNSTGRGR